jgi:hypothetical protein
MIRLHREHQHGHALFSGALVSCVVPASVRVTTAMRVTGRRAVPKMPVTQRPWRFVFPYPRRAARADV